MEAFYHWRLFFVKFEKHITPIMRSLYKIYVYRIHLFIYEWCAESKEVDTESSIDLSYWVITCLNQNLTLFSLLCLLLKVFLLHGFLDKENILGYIECKKIKVKTEG